MGYPLDIDDYEAKRLVEELLERYKRERAGCCSYCGRASDTEPCKHSGRHGSQSTIEAITVLMEEVMEFSNS